MPKLTRYGGNPIIAPRPGQGWEAYGTFNPGAVYAGGMTHILYRAVDEDQISRLGYARSENGTAISSRPLAPVLEPTADWEEFGCEDPRITPIDGAFFVTYTAFSRRGPRIALASTKNFSHFEKHGLVGPDLDDKDCVLFPERIDGKIAVLHRLESKVQIAYFQDIAALSNSTEFWNEYVTHFHDFEVMRPKFPWEETKVGVGPPPIRTENGWLVIYHGVSAKRVYRAGAVLLDLDEPTKVLSRATKPILQPEVDFEKQGAVPNVVFPDGAIVQNGELMTYYGGADRVCCVASAPIDEFLDDLENER